MRCIEKSRRGFFAGEGWNAALLATAVQWPFWELRGRSWWVLSETQDEEWLQQGNGDSKIKLVIEGDGDIQWQLREEFLIEVTNSEDPDELGGHVERMDEDCLLKMA